MLTVGLTGGIGAGKSVVARRLAARGAMVIDADVLAREVVAPGTPGLAEVVAALGPGVLGAGGSLDRAAVGAVVFRDPGARRRLEAVIHPRVRARTAELVAAAPADAVVVNDVPLLVEAGLAATYHLVIVVEAAERIRIDRLVRDRGMPEADARARIRAQAADTDRRAAADVLLTNDTSLAGLHATVDALWRDRLAPFEENLRLRRPARRPERLAIVPYDPQWPAAYQRLAARLRHTTGEAAGDAAADTAGDLAGDLVRGVAQRIDHVGSTAVPGLATNDIIDIQMVVADLAAAQALAEPLARAGFPPPDGDWSDNPKPFAPDPARWRKLVHGSADPGRIVHLHLRPAGSPGWRVALLLRDWLRTDAPARAEYAAHTQRLQDSGLTTSQYADRKELWFDEIWPRAQRWASATGWRP